MCCPIGRFLGSAFRLPWNKRADVLVELAREALYQGVRSGMALLPITKYFCEAKGLSPTNDPRWRTKTSILHLGSFFTTSRLDGAHAVVNALSPSVLT